MKNMQPKKSKKSLFFAAVFLTGCMAAHAKTAGNDKKTLISINVGQMTVVPVISAAMYDNFLYLPVHVHGYRSLNRNFALSGLVLFRAEKNGDVVTMETGLAVGPCFTSNHLNGFFADCKVGFAFAFGQDYHYNDYVRTDFVLQPEVGYFLTLAGRFTMSVGLGMQSLLKIVENPRREDTGWDWNSSGKMSHYFLPVLNVSLGIKF